MATILHIRAFSKSIVTLLMLLLTTMQLFNDLLSFALVLVAMILDLM